MVWRRLKNTGRVTERPQNSADRRNSAVLVVRGRVIAGGGGGRSVGLFDRSIKDSRAGWTNLAKPSEWARGR